MSDDPSSRPSAFVSDAARPPSPTPSQREKLDAEARKKEEEEQATLPYKWRQTIGEVDVTIPVAGNLKARDLVVDINKAKIKAGIKGGEMFIEVSGEEESFRLW